MAENIPQNGEKKSEHNEKNDMIDCMKNAVIIHGMMSKKEYNDPVNPPPTESHWLPWIREQLMKNGIFSETPEMPLPYRPEYSTWKKKFEKSEINENTILIGHSAGAGFLVRYLSENKIGVGKVVLVAPWIDPENILQNSMFDFLTDRNIVAKTSGITIFNSSDDMDEVHKSVTRLKNEIANIKVVEFENMGHFCYGDMGTDAFPELLTEALAS